MKRIRIFGCTLKPRLKAETRSATEYIIELLLPRKRKLDLSICYIEGLYDDYGVVGECWDNDNHTYNIRIEKSLDEEQAILTLAHELIHLKQFAKGELKFGFGKDRWLGKSYPITTPYSKQPWEKEARKLENILYADWKLFKITNESCLIYQQP